MLKVYYNSIKLVWKSVEAWFFVTTTLLIFLSLEPIISISLVNNLVNSVQKMLIAGSKGINLIIVILMIQVILSITTNVIQQTQIFLDNKCQIVLEKFLNNRIFKQMTTIPYEQYEDVDYQNHLDRLGINKGNKFMAPIKSFLDIIRSTITFILLFVYLYHLNSLISLLFISFVPLICINLIIGKKQFYLHVYQSPNARRMSYLDSLLTSRNTGKELRTFNIGTYFIKSWNKTYDFVNNKVLQLNKNTLLSNILIIILEGLVFLIISLTSVRLVLNRELSFGSFVALAQSTLVLNTTLESISNSITTIYTESFFLSDILELFRKEKPIHFENNENFKLTKAKWDSISSNNPLIEFRHVNFNYPHSNQNVLVDINFKINKGEKCFIVGENGSGKTTLIKCLLGLYKINSGEILICGTNINDIELESLYKFVAVIFQDYIKYNLSLKENIVLNKKFNRKKFDELLKQLDLYELTNKLPDKEDTYLGKMYFEGEDLSGGQWQKIALLRSFYHEGHLFIMDEPAASLDAKMEDLIYSKIKEIKPSETIIYTSHRLAFANVADKLIFLKNGKITGIGSHNELMRTNDDYMKMYNIQVRWYK